MHGTIQNYPKEIFSNKTAFVLNANAKNVSDKVVERLIQQVPAGDLFYSRSFEESKKFYRTILRRGYGQVFCGGGDGTVMNAINLMREIAKEEGIFSLPKVGVLKLGTGNALASVLGSKSPYQDADYLVKGGQFGTRSMQLIECDDGSLTPFAGIGYDGEVLNDYRALKKRFSGPFMTKIIHSLLGYLIAGFMFTVPRQFRRKKSQIRVVTKEVAYKMTRRNGHDVPVKVPAGTLLYEGPAPIASVGAIPCFGYGMTVFPFSAKKAGFVQLRISACSLWTLVIHFYPAIWKGTFRHPQMHDFLIQDVTIESEQEMPYQVGGDACGYRHALSFKVAKEHIKMVELPQKRTGRQKVRSWLLSLRPVFARF